MLGALAIVCAARPLLAHLPAVRLDRRKLAVAVVAALAAYTGAVAAAGIRARPERAAAPLAHTGRLPQDRDPPLQGRRDACSTGPAARSVAADLVADLAAPGLGADRSGTDGRSTGPRSATRSTAFAPSSGPRPGRRSR